MSKGMSKTGQYIFGGIIGLIWAVCLLALGPIGIIFAIGGTITMVLFYGAGKFGSNVAKGAQHLANQYEEEKKQ